MKAFIRCCSVLLLLLILESHDVSAQTPKRVGILLYQNVELLDFAGPAEVFKAAGFDVVTLSVDGKKIVSQGFLNVDVDYSVKESPELDILIIPGGNTASVANNKEVLDWVTNSHKAGAICMSVCTGATVLGNAGLLNGLKVTTWYGYIPTLQNKFPETTVMKNTRFVDNGNIMTTAGVSAGIDGALYMVAKILGPKEAEATAKYMEYDKWNLNDGLIEFKHPFIVNLEKNQFRESSVKVQIAQQGSDGEYPYIGEYLMYVDKLRSGGKVADAIKALEIGRKIYPYSFSIYGSLRTLDTKYQSIPSEEEFIGLLSQNYEKALTKQKEIANNFPGWLFFSENAINSLGYTLLESNAEKAVAVFLVYTKAYPNSFNAFDSLGEAYMKLGDNENAIRNYEKSVALNPKNTNGISMLKKLKGV
jgi:putative intracellular protease/amidase